MKTIYLDQTQNLDCMSIFIKDTQIIPAGTTLSIMPSRHQNAEYQRFAREYDIHFLFEDDPPTIDFYAVPRLDIFAGDSQGGYLCSLKTAADFESDANIIYVDQHRRCFLVAENGASFLQHIADWQNRFIPLDEIRIFSSLADAQKEYEFFIPNSLPLS